MISNILSPTPSILTALMSFSMLDVVTKRSSTFSTQSLCEDLAHADSRNVANTKTNSHALAHVIFPGATQFASHSPSVRRPGTRHATYTCFSRR